MEQELDVRGGINKNNLGSDIGLGTFSGAEARPDLGKTKG